MSVRDTSSAAYHESADRRAQCQEKILGALQELGAASRRQLAQKTGLEVSCVAGRVNELLKAGAIQEEEQPRPCPITHRNVHWVALAA